ncbi:MAG: restriction endonuclease subunit S [Nanoarchaeota archaeon]
MKKTNKTKMWDISNILRNIGHSNMDSLDILSTITIAKLLSKGQKLNSYKETNRIIQNYYPDLVDEKTYGKLKPETSKTLFREINAIDSISSLTRFFANQVKGSRFFMPELPEKSLELSKISNVPKDGKIADFWCNSVNFTREVIIQHNFKGEINLYSTDKRRLRLAFLYLYPLNKNIIIHSSKNFENQDRFDYVFAMPPLGTNYKLDTLTNIVDNVRYFLKKDGCLTMVTTANFLSGERYKSMRKYILTELNLDSIIGFKNAFRPITSVQTAMVQICNSKKSKRKTYVAEVDFSAGDYEEVSSVLHSYMDHVRGKTTKTISPLTNRVEKKDLEFDFTIQRFNPGLEFLEKKFDREFNLTPLKNTSSIYKGSSSYSAKDNVKNSNNSVPYIRIQNLKHGGVDIGNAIYVKSPNKNDTVLKEGDILVSISGTIGKTALVDKSSKGAIISPGLVILRPTKKLLEPYYLYYILQSSYVLRQLKSLASGSTISRISIKKLQELKIPLLPLDKQKSILKKINSLRSQIERLDKKKRYLENQLQNQLDEVFF